MPGGTRPGIPGLLSLLARRWEAIEADLLRVYGVDLLGLFRGELTLRRLAVLVRGMPPGSTTAFLEGGRAAWSNEVAAVHEEGWLLRDVVVQLLAGKGAKRPPAPEPPEPGWLDKAAAREDKQLRKLENWLARHPEVQA
ncbi:hypothetical protein I6B53_03250 [Schaalia sp. 19OD2882]|uniref:hypothetical protein n=1 Tax=Schaalia sp. 19OD2882 TaxID=2794089 RepID=UPI001C1EDB4A|nr:hypothetical protein [Schaalia sp. 19OD2882]QWW20127.1 hypothetical protein I6B53_03250 [Schaalia sp. 19OD2882]